MNSRSVLCVRPVQKTAAGRVLSVSSTRLIRSLLVTGSAQNAPLPAIHFSPPKSDGSGVLPINVLESTLPVARSRVVIVLTLRWTETSTLPSFEKYVSLQPMVLPPLSLLINIRVLLHIDLGTASGATGEETRLLQFLGSFL